MCKTDVPCKYHNKKFYAKSGEPGEFWEYVKKLNVMEGKGR